MSQPSPGGSTPHLRVYPSPEIPPLSNLDVEEWESLLAVMRQNPGLLRADEANRLLATLDVPDCKCSPVTSCGHDGDCDCAPELALKLAASPCPHMEEFLDRLAAGGFPLDYDQWAEMMHLLLADEYTAPPPPPERFTLTKKEAIVQAMALRDGYTDGGKSAKQWSLYHPRDTWRLLPATDVVRVSREARHSKNGQAARTADRGPLRVVGKEVPQSEPLTRRAWVDEIAGVGIVADNWRRLVAAEEQATDAATGEAI